MVTFCVCIQVISSHGARVAVPRPASPPPPAGLSDSACRRLLPRRQPPTHTHCAFILSRVRVCLRGPHRVPSARGLRPRFTGRELGFFHFAFPLRRTRSSAWGPKTERVRVRGASLGAGRVEVELAESSVPLGCGGSGGRTSASRPARKVRVKQGSQDSGPVR